MPGQGTDATIAASRIGPSLSAPLYRPRVFFSVFSALGAFEGSVRPIRTGYRRCVFIPKEQLRGRTNCNCGSFPGGCGAAQGPKLCTYRDRNISNRVVGVCYAIIMLVII